MCRLFADYGFYKLEAKTKAANGVAFTTNGSSNHDSGRFNGSLETKYKWSDYGKVHVCILKICKQAAEQIITHKCIIFCVGLTFTEKWNTDNTLGTDITIEDQIVKGMKLAFDTQFAPQTG